MNKQLHNRKYPLTWEILPLSTFAKDGNTDFVDGPFGSDLKVSDYTETGIRVLQLQNLGDGKFIDENQVYTSHKKALSLRRCITHPGDIIIAKMAEPLARASLVPDNEDEYLIVADLIRLRVSQSVNPYYLVNLINFSDFRKEAERLSTGTTRTRISLSTLKKISIPKPPPKVQEKLGHIFNTIDRAIAHTEALIEKYQQIKAGLMHDLFTRGIGADGKLRPPRDEAPELYQESAIGWIPKNWIITKADSLITGIDAGKSPECPDQPASADQWGVLKVSAVHPDGLKQTENKVVSKLQYQIPGLLVKEGDLLITRANTPELVGMICHVEQVDRKLILSDKTLRLRVDSNRIDKRFSYWVFQHPKTRNQIEIDATGSSGSMKNISQRNIRNLDIAIPNSLGEQETIRMRLDSIFNKVKKDTFSKNKLEKQKSGLMQDLLTGKVPVKVDSDEVDHISN